MATPHEIINLKGRVTALEKWVSEMLEDIKDLADRSLKVLETNQTLVHQAIEKLDKIDGLESRVDALDSKFDAHDGTLTMILADLAALKRHFGYRGILTKTAKLEAA